MKRITGKPDPLDFPPPDQWATFVPHREPQFKTHKHLSQAKNAVSGKFVGARINGVYSWQAPNDMWVYQWDTEEQRWVERYEIVKGSTKDTHPLWTTKVATKKVPREVPQKVVDKTIASIMKAVR